MWVQSEARYIGRVPKRAAMTLRPDDQKQVAQQRPKAEANDAQPEQTLPLVWGRSQLRLDDKNAD